MDTPPHHTETGACNASPPPGLGDELAAAREATAAKMWRRALCLLQPLADSGSQEALSLLAEVLCAAGKPAQAAERLQTALGSTHTVTGRALLLRQLGDCHLQAQQWQEALKCYKEALSTLPPDDDATTQQQRPSNQQHPSQQQQQHEDNSHGCQLELQACCAAAMYPLGGAHAEAAVHLAHSLLQQQQQQHTLQQQQQQDNNHKQHSNSLLVLLLRLHTQIATDRQQWPAAARAAVQLLSVCPQGKPGAQMLAQAVQHSSGMEALQAALVSPPDASNSANTATALATVANTLLQQGAAQQAVQLYTQAVHLHPTSSRCALGLAQALEVLCDYAGVLRVLLGYCAANPGQQLGPAVSLKALTELQDLQALSQHTLPSCSLDWYQRQPSADAQWHQQQLLQQEEEAGQAVLNQQQQESSTSSPCDLQALALLFTAAKVLFCGGALTSALRLLQLCQPAQQAAAALQPLHQSSIRNEAAYAVLLLKLLQQAPPNTHAHTQRHPKGCDVLYVCGDSHILPLAWRTVVISGRELLMVPLLLTGCKVWHLRAGSTHPSAQQFGKVLQTALPPAGAKVLLVLGELDCREGLLMAVEKLKYECLEEAAAATVAVYVAAIQRLFEQRQRAKVWVHSVPPVLPETRHVVQLFNRVLKQQLQTQAVAPAADGTGAEVGGSCRVEFVDLHDVLLQDASCLTFDGSHLHPAYLQHLQAALQCNTERCC